MVQKGVIGQRIKQLRTERSLTLKQLSDKTGLSTGFLSQMERGRSNIAVDSLNKIAVVLETTASSLFAYSASTSGEVVVRSFEQEHSQLTPGIIQAVLSNNINDFNFLPRLYQLLPSDGLGQEEIPMYNHGGQEFIYVLEGILTLRVGDREYVLNPGDSAQIHSTDDHNWINRTSRITKFLAVNMPNPFCGTAEKDSRACGG